MNHYRIPTDHRRGLIIGLIVAVPMLLLAALLIHPHDTERAVDSLTMIGGPERTRWLAAHILDRFYDGMPLVGVLGLGLQLGMVLLGIGLIRSGAVPRWAAALVVISPVLIAAVGPAVSPQVAALVIGPPFVAGVAGCAPAIARVADRRPVMDAEFATIGG